MNQSGDDYALALQLQQQYDSEFSGNAQGEPHILGDNTSNFRLDDPTLQMVKQFSDYTETNYTSKANNKESSVNGDNDHGNMSLVDPKWELIDPNPDVRMLFLQFNERFFWGKLSSVEVRWSPRMTLCAGLCVYEGRGGLCSVRLSTPLLKLRPRKDLIETLLHEMIHAYLFVTDNNKDHDGHGPEFHKHMYRINGETGTKISVYHNFHDEVASYKQHWWRCDGPCRTKPPYFGFVKRAMNRAPSARDFWWGSHVQTCGGTYTKVKEPEGYGEKKKKTSEPANKKEKSAKDSENMDIRSMFGKKDVGNKSQIAGTSVATNTTDSMDKNKVKSHEGKKKANIAGFVRDESGNGLNVYKDRGNVSADNPSTSMDSKLGVNLAGFQRNQDGLKVYKTNDKKTVTESSPQYFKGEGNLIGGSQIIKPQQMNNIVRKLPGFGVIKNERPLFSQENKNTNESEKDMDSDDPNCIIFSPNKNKSKTTINKASTSSQYKNKSATSALDLSDSDSEFDNLLKRLPKKKKLRKSTDGNVTLDKFVTKEGRDIAKFKPGFKSVSQKNNSSSSKGKRPDSTDKARKVESNSSFSIKEKTKSHDTSAGEKNKIDFTSGRNKRAHDLDGSSDDTDNEIDMLEKQSLASVARKRQRHKSPGFEPNSTVHSQQSKLTNSISQQSVENNGAGSSSADKVPCPVCQTQVEPSLINQHLDTCLS